MKVYEGYDTSEINRIQNNCKNSGYKVKIKARRDDSDRWGGYPLYSVEAIPLTQAEKEHRAFMDERNRKIKEAITNYKSIGQPEKIQEEIDKIKNKYNELAIS